MPGRLPLALTWANRVPSPAFSVTDASPPVQVVPVISRLIVHVAPAAKVIPVHVVVPMPKLASNPTRLESDGARSTPVEPLPVFVSVKVCVSKAP
jgi:hypothetical protein